MTLTPPPRDQFGTVQPHDHPQIDNNDGIIRRVPQNWVVPGKDGAQRLSSMAYKASSGDNGGMSVDIEKLIVEAGINPRTHVTTPRWVGSIRFIAGDLRAEGLQVGYDPLEEELPDQPANPYHGEVWGAFPRAKQKRLSQLAEWYVEIENVGLAIG